MQTILEISKNKTKIVAYGDDENLVAKIVLHTTFFLGKEIDFVAFGRENTSPENDFILFELNSENADFLELKPNILAICKKVEHRDYFSKCIESITSGGILIYDESDSEVAEIVENSTNYFRRITYQSPHFQKNGNLLVLQTELGEISLKIEEKDAPLLEASRLLCQQIGIQEEEFYEALLNFDF